MIFDWSILKCTSSRALHRGVFSHEDVLMSRPTPFHRLLPTIFKYAAPQS